MATFIEVCKEHLRSTYSALDKAMNSRWFLGGTDVGVFVFTVVRGIPAWPLMTYGMQIWLFILIDLITAYPYVWAIKNVVTGLRTRGAWKLTGDGIIVAVSFLAPYVYILWSAGEAMPIWALTVAITVIVVLALVGPIRKIVGAMKGVR